MLETYKIYALYYGFLFGSFATFVVKVSTTPPGEEPMMSILRTSLWTGVLIGVVGWVFYFLVKTSISSGHGSTSGSSSDSDSYGGGGDYSGGSDGGGGGGD